MCAVGSTRFGGFPFFSMWAIPATSSRLDGSGIATKGRNPALLDLGILRLLARSRKPLNHRRHILRAPAGMTPRTPNADAIQRSTFTIGLRNAPLGRRGRTFLEVYRGGLGRSGSR